MGPGEGRPPVAPAVDEEDHLDEATGKDHREQAEQAGIPGSIWMARAQAGRRRKVFLDAYFPGSGWK